MDQTLAVVRPEDAAEPPSRPPGGVGATVVLLVLALSFVAWSALSFLEFDDRRFTVALVALTQYAVPVGVLLTLLGLALRRWLTTLVVGLVTVALAVSVAPRAIPDSAAPTPGTPLRVLSINLHMGDGQARRVVQLVRENRVDLLSLQELTEDSVAKLDRAGLGALLPHRHFQPDATGAGTGIASRYPLEALDLVPPTTLRQPSARVKLPGGEIELVAVHPMYPVGVDTTTAWRNELTALPDPTRDNAKAPRVLAGDFNATLDHTPLQALLGRGYRDAAEVTGDGLRPTWPGPGVLLPPPVTIDHVLVSGGVGVRSYRTFDVAGSDHRAVLATLVVPAK